VSGMKPQRHVRLRRCLLCGRPLKDPLSTRRGIGPVCWKRMVPELRKNGGTVGLEIDPGKDCTPGEDIHDYTANFRTKVGHSRASGRATLRMTEDGRYQIYVRWHGNLVDRPETVLCESEDLRDVIRWGNRFFGTDDRLKEVSS